MELFNLSEPRITLEEIATANQVSLSTVYRVLRGACKTRVPRHDRVRLMLANAGYLQHGARVAGVVMIVASDYTTSHSRALVEFLRELCEKSGIETLLTLPTSLRSELRRRPVAGIVSLSNAMMPEDLEVPCIYLNCRDPQGVHSAVVQSLDESILVVLRYLRDKGFTKFGLFEEINMRRFLNFLKVGSVDIGHLFAVAGVELNPGWYFRSPITSASHMETCQAAAEYFAGLKERPEVLVCRGELTAVTVAGFLGKRNIHAPQDICFAASEDSLHWPWPSEDGSDYIYNTVVNSYSRVPMILRRTPLREMAAAALELLQNALRNPKYPARQVEICSQVEEYEPDNITQ